MLTENVEKMTRRVNEQNEALKMLEHINHERNARQHQELKVAFSQSSTVLSMPTLLEQLSSGVFVLMIVAAAYFGIKRMYCDLSRPHRYCHRHLWWTNPNPLLLLVVLTASVAYAAEHECSKNHAGMCTGFNFNSWKKDFPNLYWNKKYKSGSFQVVGNTGQPSAREKAELIKLTKNALKKLDHLTDVQQQEAMTQWTTLLFDFAFSTKDLESAKGGAYPFGSNVGSASVHLLNQLFAKGIIHNWNRLGLEMNEFSHDDLESGSDFWLEEAKRDSK